MLNAATATPQALEAHGLLVNQDGARRSAFELAAQPQFPIATLARVWPELAEIPAGLVRRLEADAKYAVYLDRQADDVARYRRDEFDGRCPPTSTTPAFPASPTKSGTSSSPFAPRASARPAASRA